MATAGLWYQEIWDIHSKYFVGPDEQNTWEEHLIHLNSSMGSCLGNKRRMTPAPSLPPPWFVGEIDRVRDQAWTLAVSINPKIDADDQATMDWYRGQEFTPRTYWDHWCQFNLGPRWNKTFVSPLVRLAAWGLNEPIPIEEADVRTFAATRMLFIELCPYASDGLPLNVRQASELAKSDIGFKLAERVRHTLIERGRPRFVLVNGVPVGKAMETAEKNAPRWHRCDYMSVERLKALWHVQGQIEANTGAVPILGFPFLRKSNTHNSNPEVDQLGAMIRNFLSATSTEP